MFFSPFLVRLKSHSSENYFRASVQSQTNHTLRNRASKNVFIPKELELSFVQSSERKFFNCEKKSYREQTIMSKLLIGLKICIVTYALWRFSLGLYHIIANNLVFSSKTFLSIAILLSCCLLLCAVLFESRVLIEIWMICFILKFGAIIFGVSQNSFEIETKRKVEFLKFLTV